ncbi:MAG: hypothetical protein KDA79_05385 [Planctomycetaceae bacterium]|nr:hypothetical protein [Planctomycetaceae bacterium]
MTRLLRASYLPALLAAAMLSAGCSSAPDDAPVTHEVTGTVTFEGEPVPEASMVFEDAAGKERSFGAMVQNGEFSTQMTAGKKKVRITATREVPGKTEPGPSGEPGVPATEQYIPAKYNTETTLEEEVTADGENHFEFQLTAE